MQELQSNVLERSSAVRLQILLSEWHSPEQSRRGQRWNSRRRSSSSRCRRWRGASSSPRSRSHRASSEVLLSSERCPSFVALAPLAGELLPSLLLPFPIRGNPLLWGCHGLDSMHVASPAVYVLLHHHVLQVPNLLSYRVCCWFLCCRRRSLLWKMKWPSRRRVSRSLGLRRPDFRTSAHIPRCSAPMGQEPGLAVARGGPGLRAHRARAHWGSVPWASLGSCSGPGLLVLLHEEAQGSRAALRLWEDSWLREDPHPELASKKH